MKVEITDKDTCDIFIVDDEPVIVDLICYLLREYFPSIRIEFAFNGQDAYTRMEKIKPKIVLTDLAMPVMNGWDLIKIIKLDPNLKETKIVVLSAHSRSEDRIKGMQLGADRYLCKPCEPEEIFVAIRQLL
ncbi:MAG TPA: response regulator [Blastocatellia bacterium]|nr:response regulator [Blastocatellia bacterium]